MFDLRKTKLLKMLNTKMEFEKKKQIKDQALDQYIKDLKNVLQNTSEEGKTF